jgi:hypothetical protein
MGGCAGSGPEAPIDEALRLARQSRQQQRQHEESGADPDQRKDEHGGG